MRLRHFVAAAFVLSANLAAHADSTFTLTLTPDSGFGGTGALVVDVAPSSTGASTYFPGNPAGSDLEALSFTIDGQTYDLANDFGAAEVDFYSGMLVDVFFGTTRSNFYTVFDDYVDGVEGAGTISATPVTATSVTRALQLPSARHRSPGHNRSDAEALRLSIPALFQSPGLL